MHLLIYCHNLFIHNHQDSIQLHGVIMVKIKEFRPFMFSGETSKFVSPPFDSISKNMEKELKKDNMNVSCLTLPENGDITKVSKLLQKWIEDGALHRVPSGGIFVIDQQYEEDGNMKRLTGMVCLVKIFPENDDVKPHEKTFPKPVDERARIMLSSKAQLEPVYFAVNSEGLEKTLQEIIEKKERIAAFSDYQNVKNSIYFVSDNDSIGRLKELLKESHAVIADGHHRTKATIMNAQNSSDPVEKEFWSNIMAYVVPIQSEGLKIDGINRLIQKECSSAIKAGNSVGGIEFKEEGCSDEKFKIYNGKMIGVHIKGDEENGPEEKIPIGMVNKKILEGICKFEEDDFADRISYFHDQNEVVEEVERNPGSFAIILPKWNKRMFIDVMEKVSVLPQKSTYFFPKIPSGILINLFRSSE